MSSSGKFTDTGLAAHKYAMAFLCETLENFDCNISRNPPLSINSMLPSYVKWGLRYSKIGQHPLPLPTKLRLALHFNYFILLNAINHEM